MRDDNFDREFDKTSRLIRYGMMFTGAISLIVLTLFIAAVYAVGRYFGVW